MNILYVNSLEANNKELRQQLAERDAEIAAWRSQAHRSQSDADRLEAECDQLRQQLAASQQAISKVCEEWSGIDGMPQPEDEVGWYLFQLVEKMRDAAKEGMK